jgi:hypothetical protein
LEPLEYLNLHQILQMIKKNIISIILALVILYLSLSPADTYEGISIFNIPFIDKIVHFCMYFMLMSAIVLENRKTIKNIGQVILISLIPISYGICIEILQSLLTESRTGSFYDVVFNSAGILFSIIFWLFLNSFKEKIIK